MKRRIAGECCAKGHLQRGRGWHHQLTAQLDQNKFEPHSSPAVFGEFKFLNPGSESSAFPAPKDKQNGPPARRCRAFPAGTHVPSASHHLARHRPNRYPEQTFIYVYCNLIWSGGHWCSAPGKFKLKAPVMLNEPGHCAALQAQTYQGLGT